MIFCLNEGRKACHVKKSWLIILVQHKLSTFTSAHIVLREFLQLTEQDTSPHWTATLVQTATPLSKNLPSSDVTAVCYKGSRGCTCTPANQRVIPELLSTKQLCNSALTKKACMKCNFVLDVNAQCVLSMQMYAGNMHKGISLFSP